MNIKARCKRCGDVIELPSNKHNMKQCFCGEIYVMVSKETHWGSSLRPGQLEWFDADTKTYRTTP